MKNAGKMPAPQITTIEPIWDLDHQVRKFLKNRQKHGDCYVRSNPFRGSLEG